MVLDKLESIMKDNSQRTISNSKEFGILQLKE